MYPPFPPSGNGEFRVLVETLNGERLQDPVEIALQGCDWIDGAEKALSKRFPDPWFSCRAYITGEFVGFPDELGVGLFPQPSFYFREFLVGPLD
jgi:hypothetical protein